ncbi:MAG: DUF998 domain-containing protein [Ktedonobacterales bacterium]
MDHTSEPISTADGSVTSSSGLWKGLQSPLTFWLVMCGGVGALLFTVTYLIEGFTRPGYDAGLQAIAALSLGPGGWVQQVNFVVFGILMLLSAVGWYRVLVPGRDAIWFPVFQGIGGLSLIGIGVVSVLTPLHTILAWALILSLALGCPALGAQLVRVRHFRGWAVYSYITGLLILIFWGAFEQGTSGNVAGLVPITGLTERLSAGSHALWLCAVTVALLIRSRKDTTAKTEQAIRR